MRPLSWISQHRHHSLNQSHYCPKSLMNRWNRKQNVKINGLSDNQTRNGLFILIYTWMKKSHFHPFPFSVVLLLPGVHLMISSIKILL